MPEYFAGLLLCRNQRQFHTAVLLTTSGRGVAGNWLTGAITGGPGAGRVDALIQQEVPNGTGATLRQQLVVAIGTGAVGMTVDLDHGFVEFLQHQRHGFQHAGERRANGALAGIEGDVAWHDQLDLITVSDNPDTSTLKALPELGFLAIHVVANTTTHSRTAGGTDQGAFTTVTAAGCGSTYRSTADGTDNTALGSAGGLLLARVRVVGHTARKAEGSYGKGNQGFFHGQVSCFVNRYLVPDHSFAPCHRRDQGHR